MEYLNTAQELLDFIMRCKSPFHVVKEASDLLNENGYTKLEETKEWSLVPGGKYYVTRNESSVIAFQIPESAFSSYQIIASHSDCPTFKVKHLSKGSNQMTYSAFEEHQIHQMYLTQLP